MRHTQNVESPYPAGCSGPPELEEYDGPEIEAVYDLDRARWEATCPTCGRTWRGRREDCARWDAEDCSERDRMEDW